MNWKANSGCRICSSVSWCIPITLLQLHPSSAVSFLCFGFGILKLYGIDDSYYMTMLWTALMERAKFLLKVILCAECYSRFLMALKSVDIVITVRLPRIDTSLRFLSALYDLIDLPDIY